MYTKSISTTIRLSEDDLIEILKKQFDMNDLENVSLSFIDKKGDQLDVNTIKLCHSRSVMFQ